MNKEIANPGKAENLQAKIKGIRGALESGTLGVDSLNGQTGKDWTREQWEDYIEDQLKQEQDTLKNV